MGCANCGRENRDDAAFCSGCGDRLSVMCGHCDRELALDARFCDGCGSPIGEPAPAGAAVRKTVTALFCDLVGSTSFGERVDAESAREAMSRYHAMAQGAIEAQGGTVAKFIGDGVMALFGVPEVAHDDAERAVRAGLALQSGFGEIRDHIRDRYSVEVGLRVGINTGEVVIADADADIVGDTVNTAARLEAACVPGRVLAGESTFRLTRGAVEFGEPRHVDAKGKDEPVAAYEVLAARALVNEAEELATPFVGREEELRRLRLVLEDTILERRAELVSVIGAPGVGKTRLAREMRAAIEGGTMAFELRCERSGTASFAPIAELLRTVAGITDAHTVDEMTSRVRAVVADLDDADRVGDMLCGFVGAGPMRSTEEMFLAVRRLFEVLGADQPLVLVVDDIQWAEPLFLDLLEHLAEWVQTVPLLVVCLARPEIREVRAALAETGRRVAEVVNLEGLSAEATSELAARLVGADALPAELLARIPESTEGNPLFVRELMRMLVDDGVISDASGRWEMMIDVDAVEVPPTINSLLATRVERMPPEERRVLELAAVVGSEFPIGAVRAAGDQSRGALESVFERLRRKELIEPTGSYWGDEPVYRFHHVLIRDAAYRRLLKGARAELHTEVGEWTEQTAASLVGEHEVAIAHHFEQAHLYRHELDLDDKKTKALGERAARLFHVAAERALEREDLAAAASLARRALGCVDDEDEEIAELLLLGCEAVLSVGNAADGVPLVDRLASVAREDQRLDAWVDCFRAQVAVLTDPGGLHDAELLADDAARRLDDLGDQAGVAKARLQRAAALLRLARVGEAETELDLALSAARAVDDRRRVTAVLGAAPIAALWGPSPVPRAGGRCLDVVRLLRITTGSPAVEATSIRCQAVLEALRGRYGIARSMLDTARSTLEELGLAHDLLETEYYAGLVELLADDPAAAEAPLRRAHDGLGQLGIGADAGQAGANLARSLLRQNRLDEAEALAVEAEALAGQNPQTGIVSRSVHAEILSARGRHGEAVALVDEAVRMAAGTDILVDHANAVAAQARVRAAARDAAGAMASADAANALYEQKGATIRVEVGAPFGDDDPTRVETGTGEGAEPVQGRQAGQRLDEPWNRADELTRKWASTRDGAELLGPQVEIDDRRRIVAEPGDDLVVRSGMQENFTAQHVRAVEVIAVRGDLLSLHRMEWRSDDGRDLEWELLTVVEFSEAGLPVRAVLFEVEQLLDAVAELDRLHCESLPLSEALHFDRSVELPYRELVDGDLDRFVGRFHPGYQILEHRPLGWEDGDRHVILERIRSIADVADRLVAFAERVHRLDQYGAVLDVRYEIDTKQGATLTQRYSFFQGWAEWGGLLRSEQFDEGEHDRAIAAHDQWRVAQRTRPRSNLAAVVLTQLNLELRLPGSRIEAFVADPERFLSLGPMPLGGTDGRILATAGDLLALAEVQRADGAWAFFLAEVDEEGLLTDWTAFAADELRAAIDLLHDSYMGHTDDPARVAALRFARAMGNASHSALDEAMADDFVAVDHRQLGFAELSRQEQLNLSSNPSSPMTVLVPVEILTSSGVVVLARIVFYNGEAGSLLESIPGYTMLETRDGKVARVDMFDDGELAEATARFEELSAPTPMKSIAERQFDWMSEGYAESVAGGMIRQGTIASPDLHVDYRMAGLRSELEPDLAGANAIELTTNAESYEQALVATRGARWLAYRASWKWKGGFESERYCVLSFGVDGTIQRHVVVDSEADVAVVLDEFEADEMRSLDLVNSATMLFERDHAGLHPVVVSVRGDLLALIEADSGDGRELRLCAASVEGSLSHVAYPVDDVFVAAVDLDLTLIRLLGGTRPAGVEAAVEFLAAHTPYDVDRLAAVMTDDFEVVTQSLLSSIDAGLAEVKLIDAGDATGGVIGTKTLALADDLALGLIESSVRISDGGAWADRWSVQILALVQMRDGKVARQEQWSVDDLDAALARFDELTTEGRAAGAQNAPWNAAAESHRNHCQRFFVEGDLASYEDAFTVDIVVDDRRRFAQVRTEGIADTLELWRIAAGRMETFDHKCLEVSGDRVALVWVLLRASQPEAFEQEALALIEIHVDGTMSRIVMFDPDQLDEARAEFDATSVDAATMRSGEADERHWNTVARVHRDMTRAFFIDGDTNSLVQAHARDAVSEDRRPHAQIRTEGIDAILDLWRDTAGLLETLEYECLDVRGDRLALTRVRLTAERPLANEQTAVSVLESDQDGRLSRTVIFEPEQIESARALFEELTGEQSDGESR